MTLDLTTTQSFPVSALCGLASITTISNVIPALADYLNRHPSAGSFFEEVVPIVLVAGLTIAVCPLLLLVANKAETLVCGYQVHNSVLWRNWVFLEINVVSYRNRMNLRSNWPSGVTQPLLYLSGNLLLCREDSYPVVYFLDGTERQQCPEQCRLRVSVSGTILRVLLAPANCHSELFRTLPSRGKRVIERGLDELTDMFMSF